ERGVRVLERIDAGVVARAALVRRDPGGMHTPLRQQPLDVSDIDLRPGAPGLAGRPPLTASALAVGVRHRVDPPEAQRLRHGLSPRQAPIRRALAAKL